MDTVLKKFSDNKLVSLITLASACINVHEKIGNINGITAAGLGIAKATCCVAMLRHVVCFSMGLALVTFSILPSMQIKLNQLINQQSN